MAPIGALADAAGPTMPEGRSAFAFALVVLLATSPADAKFKFDATDDEQASWIEPDFKEEAARFEKAGVKAIRNGDSLFLPAHSGSLIEIRNTGSFFDPKCAYGPPILDCRLHIFENHDKSTDLYGLSVWPTLGGTDNFTFIAVDPRTGASFPIGHGTLYASPSKEFILVVDHGFVGRYGALMLYQRHADRVSLEFSRPFDDIEVDQHQVTYLYDNGEFGIVVEYLRYASASSEVAYHYLVRNAQSWKLKSVVRTR